MRRHGFVLGWSLAHWLWRQAALLVTMSRPRRRIATGRPRLHTRFNTNLVWAYDFVFDTTAKAQQIKRHAVIDWYTGKYLAFDVAGSI